MKRDDDELMLLTAGGDEAAFREIVERWERPVLAFLERMVGDREEARDLAQETFYRVYRQAARYRPAGTFRAWLFRIAGNLARTALRRRRILSWVRLDPREHDRPAERASALDEVERGERVRRVRAAIARLPGRQRQAILLQRYGGLGYREIAEAMGVSVAAVESLLQRAMKALRGALRDLPA